MPFLVSSVSSLKDSFRRVLFMTSLQKEPKGVKQAQLLTFRHLTHRWSSLSVSAWLGAGVTGTGTSDLPVRAVTVQTGCV